MQSIYYNLDLKKFIDNQIYKVLKPGGKFIFSFFPLVIPIQNGRQNIKKNIYYFNKSHPNKRLQGSKYYYCKDKYELIKIFDKFKNVKVFHTKSNQTHIKENWWYVVGEK